MAKWVLRHELGFTFVAALIIGLLFISVGLFTISATVGLLGTGALIVAAGHWITYLRTVGNR